MVLAGQLAGRVDQCRGNFKKGLAQRVINALGQALFYSTFSLKSQPFCINITGMCERVNMAFDYYETF